MIKVGRRCGTSKLFSRLGLSPTPATCIVYGSVVAMKILMVRLVSIRLRGSIRWHIVRSNRTLLFRNRTRVFASVLTLNV